MAQPDTLTAVHALTDTMEGLFVPVLVRGKVVRMLIDTGATETILSAKMYHLIPRERRPPLDPPMNIMTQADGSRIDILGTAMVELAVGEKSEIVKLIVANINSDGLLGMDFLAATGGVLDIGKGHLQIGGETLRCEKEGDSNHCYRVVATETVVVPPGHEQIIMARSSQFPDDHTLGLVEPLEHGLLQSKGLGVARAVVGVHDVIPVRVMNVHQTSRVVKRGMSVATLTPVNETDIFCGSDHQGPEELAHHVKDLYKETISKLDNEYHSQVAELLMDYSDVFSSGTYDIGKTGMIKHHIHTGDAVPVRQPPRRKPPDQREEIERQVKGLLSEGLITRSNSPWSSPIVLVGKKDGTKRLCVDYRQLNLVTTKDAYPLPRIDESLDALGGARWFSTLDLASGYWQVGLDDDAARKSAFSTTSGLYEWKVLPFGLCNAPSTFERLMESVLAGLHWETLLIYLDDVIVYASSIETMTSRLRTVFQRFREAHLKLKPSKCALYRNKVKYLGHVVSDTGIHTDPEKADAIRNWPTPDSPSAVRSFLGMASYYRRFIEGFGTIAQPLHKLTEKRAIFRWTPECNTSFSILKEKLTAAPILSYPTPGDEYILDTDASGFALGAVLSQIQEGEEKVISYGSKVMSKEQRNYCTTRRELLAIITFLKKFRHYLLGRPVKVRTDHSSLKWLMRFKDADGQLARWREICAQYQLEIEYRPGKNHLNADCLSRLPCKQCGRQDQEDSVIPEADHQSVGVQCEMQSEQSDIDKACAQGSVHVVTVEPELSLAKVRDEQLKDETMGPLLLLKENGAAKPPWEDISPASPSLKTYWAQWNLLEVKGGTLTRRWESDDGKKASSLTVLPASLRTVALRELHESDTAAHFGITKTLARVRTKFYWSGMARDVRSFIRQCNTCSRRKQPVGKKKAPLQQYQVGGPMERIALDILGPLPETPDGNIYILVVGDYFTKFVEAYALPDQTAETVADKLVHEFCLRYGFPLEIHSDQGRNFESRVFQEVCRLGGIQKTRTTPYNPKSDGFIERFNRTMVNALSMMIQPLQRQTDWDTYLPYFGFAYRSCVQETTQETPNMLMFGRELKCPLDLMVEGPPHEPECDTDYAEDMRDHLREAYERVRYAVRLGARRQKRNYDRKTRDPACDVSQFVWLHNTQRKPGMSKKLHLPWDGPYLVIGSLSDVVRRIQKSPRAKPKVVHVDRLKIYQGPPLKPWKTKEPHASDTDSAKEAQHQDSEAENQAVPEDQDPPLPTDGDLPEPKDQGISVAAPDNADEQQGEIDKKTDNEESEGSDQIAEPLAQPVVQGRRNPRRDAKIPARYLM